MSRLATLLALAVAFGALAARAEDKVDLKMKHAEGDAFDVHTSLKMEMSGSVQGQALTTKHEGVQEFREKTLAVEDGKPVRAERTYKVYEQTMEQTMGTMPAQTQSRKNPIVGNTVTLVSKDGKVELEAKPAVGELNDSELDFCTDHVEALLPGEPVAVGGQWNVSDEKLKKAFGQGGMKAASVKCTLEAITGSVAKIKVAVTINGEQKGGKFTGEIEGPLLFDVSAGQPVSISLKGNVKVEMAMATLEGPMEVESTYTPAK
jgi:hypothetical protein